MEVCAWGEQGGVPVALLGVGAPSSSEWFYLVSDSRVREDNHQPFWVHTACRIGYGFKSADEESRGSEAISFPILVYFGRADEA